MLLIVVLLFGAFVMWLCVDSVMVACCRCDYVVLFVLCLCCWLGFRFVLLFVCVVCVCGWFILFVGVVVCGWSVLCMLMSFDVYCV